MIRATEQDLALWTAAHRLVSAQGATSRKGKVCFTIICHRAASRTAIGSTTSLYHLFKGMRESRRINKRSSDMKIEMLTLIVISTLIFESFGAHPLRASMGHGIGQPMQALLLRLAHARGRQRAL